MKRYLFLLLALFALHTLSAQELRFKSFECRTTDLKAKVNPQNDGNGNPCALIRVCVALKNPTIDGNMGNVGEMYSPKPSQYEVYVPAGTRRIRVCHPDYLPFTYDFNMKIEGLKTYELYITVPEAGPTKPEVKTQYLLLKVSPSNATVLIDGMPQTVTNGGVSAKFELGTHSYYISAPQHYPQEGDFTLIDSNRTNLSIELQPSHLPLNLRVTPANATVLIDGKMLELSGGSLTQKFEIGKHSYQIMASQYYTQSGEFEITASGQNSLAINLKPSYMALNLHVTPADAAVLIDGTQYQLSAGNLTQKFEIGKHSFQIMASQYHTQSGEFEITSAGATNLNIDLKPAFGLLQVGSSAVGAEVHINGEKRGVAPCKLQLPSGQYDVQLVKDGYISYQQQVTISDGVALPLNTALKANFAQVTLKAPFEKSEIWVNDQFKAKGSWSGRLDANTYLVETRTEGYENASENIEVVAEVARTYTLQTPRPIYGMVEITSAPFEATIKLDGKVVGTTPWQSNEVLTGKHTLELSKEGYETKHESFTISRDTPKNINLTLNKQGSYVPGTAITYSSLFPVLGVSLGKTTVKEMFGMGHNVLTSTGTNGYFCWINGIAFYSKDDSNNVFGEMSLMASREDSIIPESWREMGLNFSLTEAQVVQLFQRLKCQVKRTTNKGKPYVKALTSDGEVLFEILFETSQEIDRINIYTSETGSNFGYVWSSKGDNKDTATSTAASAKTTPSNSYTKTPSSSYAGTSSSGYTKTTSSNYTKTSSSSYATTSSSGSVTASTSVATKTYRVGDYYNENGKEGVVFWVDGTGKHGKIVSMTYSSRGLAWSSDKDEQKQLIGANSETDGAENMQAVKQIYGWQSKYPAFKWCADLGAGWYLPAKQELMAIRKNLDAINRTLVQKRAGKIGSFLWSSTESDYKISSTSMLSAWAVNMIGGTNYSHKSYGYSVRAVAAF